MIRRVASVLIAGGLASPWASAQGPASPAPAPSSSSGAAAGNVGNGRSSFSEPITTDPSHPNYHAGAHWTIIRHNPLPRRASSNSYDPYQERSSGGYSSPSQSGYSTGGVGRFAEYYDQNTPRGQVDQHPVPVARFDSGGGPDRAEQIAAQQNGQARDRNLQNTINTYGRPYGAYGVGFGYGLGLGGGRLYTYPY